MVMRHEMNRVVLSVDTAVLVALALVVAVPAFAQKAPPLLF
jgi:hypothetical protein